MTSKHDNHTRDVIDSDEEMEMELKSKASQLETDEVFRTSVLKYVKIDDIIREKNKELATLKKARKEHEAYIIECLNKVEEDRIDLNGGQKLNKNTKTVKSGITPELLKTALMEKIADPEIVKQYIDNIEAKRTTKTVTTISRTIPKIKGKEINI